MGTLKLGVAILLLFATAYACTDGDVSACGAGFNQGYCNNTICVCNSGWMGVNCTQCDHMSPSACSSGLGVCHNFSSSAIHDYHCVCDGRTQPNCSTPTCYRQEYGHPTDANACSGFVLLCQPDNTCLCPNAGGDFFYGGAWCQTPLHQCQDGPPPSPVNCSGVVGSQCVRDNADGHYCKCDGYVQPFCAGPTCSIVRYPDESPPPGPLCAGRGNCIFGPNICQCDVGYALPWCENRTCTNGTTICSNVTGSTCLSDGVCDCAGYTFPQCQQRTCKVQRLGHETPDLIDCAGHGVCNSTNQCTCDNPFTGPWCESDIFGCNPVGTYNVTNGTCLCKPGYTGTKYCCQLDFTKSPAQPCQFCNPGGLCNCTNCGTTSECNPLDGTCNCVVVDPNDPDRVPPLCCFGAPGWTNGTNGTYHGLLSCGGHGTCTNTMYPYDGQCVCNVDYQIPEGGCSVGPCGEDPSFNPDPPPFPRCGDISGGAYCNDIGACVNCPSGKSIAHSSGDIAIGRCCPYAPVWNSSGLVSNKTCGGSQGSATCMPDGTCRCLPNEEYTPSGPACTLGPCDGLAPAACNGHGTCDAALRCTCNTVNDTVWDGFDCGHNMCDNRFLFPTDGALRRGSGCCLGSFSWIAGVHAFRACGGHGSCDPVTHECSCFPGYSEDACELGPCGSTPLECHGHGNCNPLTHECDCDGESYGPQCNTGVSCGLYARPCNGFTNPFFEDPFFASRGVCNTTLGFCVCSTPYYTGSICEIITGCNADRSIRYNITTGKCDCIPGVGFGTQCCAQNCTLGCGGTGSGFDCACPHLDPHGGECRDCDRTTGQCFCHADADASPGMCCPLAFNPSTGNITDVCGGRGFCSDVSTCTCNAGFDGQFCCRMGCNGNGVCAKDPDTRVATCNCSPGASGNACQNLPGCPSSNSLPCSGRGTCAPTTDVSHAHLLGYINQPDGDRNMDLLWGNLTRLYLGFREDLPFEYLEIQDSAFYPGQDFTYRLIYGFVNDPRLSDRIRFFRSIPNGIHDWLYGIQTSLLSDLGTPDTSYMNTVISLINVTDGNFGVAADGRVTGVLDQMIYGLRLDFDTGIARPFMNSIPAFECQCTDDESTSVSCSDTCPLSPINGIPCTGLYFGDFHGACRYSSNTCVCGSRYLGTTCEIYRGEGCFKTNSTTTVCEGRGSCNPHGSGGTPPYGCDCNPGSNGTYCDIYVCSQYLPNLVDRMTQCSNFGICKADGNCTCNVAAQLALSHSITSPPLLPVGQNCQFNGIKQCGTATLVSGSVYNWFECDGHGTCKNDSFHATPYCKCNNGFAGAFCNITICPAPGCNSHETCDENNGVCICNPTWDTPAGSCNNGSIACRCLHSKCGHGVADPTQQICICDQFYRRDTSGSCTIVQCPLVLITDSGERPCNVTAGDRICAPGEQSHNNVCCYDACASGTGVSLCAFPTQSQIIPNCTCDPAVAYTQSLGICYSKCHGQPYVQFDTNIVCQCTPSFFLFNPLNTTIEFLAILDCARQTCLNGGVVGSNGQSCNCARGFTGSLCSQTISSSSSSSAGSTSVSPSSHSSSSTSSQSGSTGITGTSTISASSHSSSSGSSTLSSVSSSTAPSSSSSTTTSTGSSLSSTGSSSNSSTAQPTPAPASTPFWTTAVIAGVTVAAASAAAGITVAIYYAVTATTSATTSTVGATASTVTAGRARYTLLPKHNSRYRRRR